MILSRRFERFADEVKRLRRDLLPRQFKPAGIYTPLQETKAAAYRVLVHAEIEAFIEDRVKEEVLLAYKLWAEHHLVTRLLVGLLAYSGLEHELPPKIMKPTDVNAAMGWEEKNGLKRRVQRALNTYMSAIGNNHGVKEENLLRLLLPLGLNLDTFDPVWVDDMNSFGAARGTVAHLSRTNYGATVKIDPQEEAERIERLMKGLEILDDQISLVHEELLHSYHLT